MSAHDVHHKITAFRQQVETLQSAAASPAHVQAVLLEMGDDPEARPHLDFALIERFAAIDGGSYDDLRRMRAACAAAGFLTLR